MDLLQTLLLVMNPDRSLLPAVCRRKIPIRFYLAQLAGDYLPSGFF